MSQSRRHCFDASTTTRRSRSSLADRGSTTDRSVTSGTRRSIPNSVAFSTSQSNRSPFGTAEASVKRHGPSRSLSLESSTTSSTRVPGRCWQPRPEGSCLAHRTTRRSPPRGPVGHESDGGPHPLPGPGDQRPGDPGKRNGRPTSSSRAIAKDLAASYRWKGWKRRAPERRMSETGSSTGPDSQTPDAHPIDPDPKESRRHHEPLAETLELEARPVRWRAVGLRDDPGSWRGGRSTGPYDRDGRAFRSVDRVRWAGQVACPGSIPGSHEEPAPSNRPDRPTQ